MKIEKRVADALIMAERLRMAEIRAEVHAAAASIQTKPTNKPERGQALRRRLKEAAARVSRSDPTRSDLRSATAADNSEGMAAMTREEIDAKIAAAEARNETSLATAMGEVRAEFATISQKLTDVREGQRTGFWGSAGLLAAAVAAILAALALGNDMFGRGFDASEVADRAAEKAIAAQLAASHVEAQQAVRGERPEAQPPRAK